MKENKVLFEYCVKFDKLPPLPYSLDYDDEVVVEMMAKAIKSGQPITLDDYPEDYGERVVTGLND